jgi:hypothetical protein
VLDEHETVTIIIILLFKHINMQTRGDSHLKHHFMDHQVSPPCLKLQNVDVSNPDLGFKALTAVAAAA